MKNLIIHPKDGTTDFLKPIYKNIEAPVLLSGGVNTQQILNYLNKCDRALMMGHGSPGGLFSIGKFQTGVYVIGSWCIDSLIQKTENVYIWCNADKFVEKYRLKGFYTGMFISEVAEATFCGVRDITQDQVDESNHTFAEIMMNIINLPKKEIFENVKKVYGKLANKNPVALYNWKRMYVS